MLNPDEVTTTMAAQRDQERAADAAHYKLRKACAERAVELRDALSACNANQIGPEPCVWTWQKVAALLKEIDDASH